MSNEHTKVRVEKAGNPIISVDCKKKEQIGNFKNNGKEWTRKGKENEIQINAYDFRSLAQGLAIPYGIYDKLKKENNTLYKKAKSRGYTLEIEKRISQEISMELRKKNAMQISLMRVSWPYNLKKV